MIPYDAGLVETVAHTLDLRTPNRNALDTLAQHLADSDPGTSLVADLATGVGKTFIAGGLIDYLADSGTRNILIVTPGKTIQQKTVDNFTPGHRKYLRGLRADPIVITLDDIERGSVGQALEDATRVKLFVFTVQSLLRPDTKDARRAHRAHENIGIAVYEYLRAASDLVIIADEHHIYYSGSAKKFEAAINDLEPEALIGLTATPDESSLDQVVFKYPLADAIADGYVKIPVLVARPDGIKDTRTQLADGLQLLDAKKAAINAYCKQTKQKTFEPVMFVVCQTIDEASEIRDLLKTPEFLNDPNEKQVLLVVSDEKPEEALALLDTIENQDSKIRVVVSVSMLKEGWDAKNIYVIAAVRALESQLLTEQILGRGLRLPFGKRTSVGMLDTVEVLSHHAFNDLLKNAKVLLEQTLGDRADEAIVTTDPEAGKKKPTGGVAAATGATTSVDISLPGISPADDEISDTDEDGEEEKEEEGGKGEGVSHPGFGISTLAGRVAQGTADKTVVETPIEAQKPGGITIPLFLPIVSTRLVRDAFSLTGINANEVEALGRQFRDDEGESLTRKALDATRDEKGLVAIEVTDLDDSVQASMFPVAYENIPTDLAKRLLRSNEVMQSNQEAEASLKLANAFLEGAGVTADTPWRVEHGRLATARLIDHIKKIQTSQPSHEVTSVELVKWPDPQTRYETRTPVDRQQITSSAEFVKNYPYSGWKRSVYAVNSFHAYSTEFRLANLFETAQGVKAWIRIDASVPLRIRYKQGAHLRTYEPDFIVVDTKGTHWIVEGKADSEMTNPIVIAKQDAAKAWISTVNASTPVTDPWAYLLASESVIAAASSWNALIKGAQSHA